MNAIATILLSAAVSAASISSGWVFRDAQPRGLPTRKALTWAALQGVEWPVFLFLYRRIRPRRLRGEAQAEPASGTP